jgi:hypothetical protein
MGPSDEGAPVPAPQPTLSEIADSLPPKAEPSKRTLPRPDAFSKFLILEGWSHWFFRFGFASIFFINAVYAAFDPKSFTDMLAANPIASALGHHERMVQFTMVNDLLLAVFIVGGWRKRMVYAWAGVWLLLVAGLKLMNLVS